MPIVTRALKQLPSAGGGALRFREDCFDADGGYWRHGPYRAASVQAAQAAMDARDWSALLKDAEEDDAVAFVRRGGDLDNFVLVELALTALRRRLVLRWMRSKLEDDKPFVARFAAYVAQFNALQIAAALDVSLEIANAVLSRATAIAGIATTVEGDDAQVVDLG